VRGLNTLATQLRERSPLLFTLDWAKVIAVALWHDLPCLPALLDHLRTGNVVSLEDLNRLAAPVNPNIITQKLYLDPAKTLSAGEGMFARVRAYTPVKHEATSLARKVYPYALPLETLGNAIALQVTWNGVAVDITRLRMAPTGGAPTRWTRSREAVAEALRNDGRIHPTYRRLGTARLMAENPQVQGFDHSNDPEAPRGLLIPSEGNSFVSLDLRGAEVCSLALAWKHRYPEDERGRVLWDMLHEGRDVHAENTEIIQSVAGAEPSREVTKAMFFQYAYLATHQKVQEGLRDAVGLGPSQEGQIYRTLVKRFPLDRWRRDLDLQAGAQRPAVSYHGRRWKGKGTGRSIAAVHLQAPVIDSVVVGCLDLIQKNRAWKPVLLAHDEVLLDMDPSETSLVQGVFCQGLRKILAGVEPQVSTKIFSERLS